MPSRASASHGPGRRAYRGPMDDVRGSIREFLTSRRARLAPEQAGLPAPGGSRRVPGLRREEVALLAGVSSGYYARLERGDLAGASDAVLDALATSLKLDDDDRQQLFDLARAGRAAPLRAVRRRSRVRPAVRQVLDAVSDAPAWVRNGHLDVVLANGMARALYSPVFAAPQRPVNPARFLFLDPAARRLWRDHDRVTREAASMLRREAARIPHDAELVGLIGELATRSELFRARWASSEVLLPRSRVTRLHHPVVGDLDLHVESLDLPSAPGLVLDLHTAPPGSASADALRLLGSWVASQRADGGARAQG